MANIGKQAIYKCEECGEIFHNEEVVKIHNRYGYNEFDYTCPMCGSVDFSLLRYVKQYDDELIDTYEICK